MLSEIGCDIDKCPWNREKFICFKNDNRSSDMSLCPLCANMTKQECLSVKGIAYARYISKWVLSFIKKRCLWIVGPIRLFTPHFIMFLCFGNVQQSQKGNLTGQLCINCGSNNFLQNICFEKSDFALKWKLLWNFFIVRGSFQVLLTT